MKNGEKLNFEGTITVFLTLSLLCIVSLISTILLSAKERSLRMRTEMAMDMGMQSIFAEYNRALLDKYDLYFIDSSYGQSNGNSYYTAKHLKDYMQYNLKTAKGQPLSGCRDLFALDVFDVDINMESLATDSNAEVYKRQAIHAIKDKYGISAIDTLKGLKNQYDGSGISDYDVEKERQKYNNKLKKASHARDENGKKLKFKNPVKQIEAKREGVLSIILNKNEVSGKSIDTSNLPTERILNTGNGIIMKDENLNSIENNLLFDCYLFDKFSSYTTDKKNEGLRYEIEYILKGKKTDSENLSAVANDLLLLREAANVIYIIGDSGKKNAARITATVPCLLILMPELIEPLTYAILFAWAFAESCVDVRTLLDGGKVPLMKSSSTWILSYTDALTFSLHLKDGSKVKQGFDYNTYLRLFMMMANSDDKVYRSMDMIETDMRQLSDNKYFKLDNCIEYIDAQAVVKSGFGFEYRVRRYFGYEKMPLMSY